MTSPSLFDSIHNGRPERLAQLVLAHALRTDARLRAFLELAGHGEVEVKTEKDVTGTRWRADIVARVGESEKAIELKLRAPVSRQQLAADAAGKIDVFVQQTGGGPVTPNARRVTWAELAEHATDPVVQGLLRQADRAQTFWCDRIESEVVEREFRAFCTAPGSDPARAWPQMYAFLSTLDWHLGKELAMYDPSGAWSHSRSASPWYGYAFASAEGESKTRDWWIGFERDSASAATILRLYRGGRRVIEELPLDVESATARVVESVSASR